MYLPMKYYFKKYCRRNKNNFFDKIKENLPLISSAVVAVSALIQLVVFLYYRSYYSYFNVDYLPEYLDTNIVNQLYYAIIAIAIMATIYLIPNILFEGFTKYWLDKLNNWLDKLNNWKDKLNNWKDKLNNWLDKLTNWKGKLTLIGVIFFILRLLLLIILVFVIYWCVYFMITGVRLHIGIDNKLLEYIILAVKIIIAILLSQIIIIFLYESLSNRGKGAAIVGTLLALFVVASALAVLIGDNVAKDQKVFQLISTDCGTLNTNNDCKFKSVVLLQNNDFCIISPISLNYSYT